MITLLLIICILILAAFSLSIIKDPITRFIIKMCLLYWGFGMTFCSTRPFNFYEVSLTTYLIVLLGIGSFIGGLMLVGTGNKYRNLSRSIKDNLIICLLNNKFFYIIILLISLYEMRFAQNALFLAAIDTESITNEKFTGVFMGNKIGIWLWMYAMPPIFYILNTLISYVLIKRRMLSIFAIISYILFYILFGILTGGRGLFANFLFSFVITYICLVPSFSFRSINIKTIIIFTFLCSILFTGMLYMSAYRRNGEFSLKGEILEETFNDLTERPLRYLALPYVLLDISFKENYLSKFGGYQLGRVTFGGADILTKLVLSKFGIKYESSEYIMAYEQNEWKSCATDHAYNYAYTAILSHYLDYGIVGVILFPFMFGYIFRLIIFQFYKLNDAWSLISINFCFFLMIQAAFSNYIQTLPIFLFFCFLISMDITQLKQYNKTNKQLYRYEKAD